MGTRCEIYLRRKWDKGDYEVVELWKHWDGEPDYMLLFFKSFFEFARQAVGRFNQKFLSYPTDVAALMIAYDYERRKAFHEELRDDQKDWVTLRPDVRPRGDAQDAEYAYILDLSEDVDFVEIHCCETEDTNGLSNAERGALKQGEFPAKPEILCLRLRIQERGD